MSTPKHPATRRQFLERSAKLTAASVAGGLALSRAVHAAGDDTIRVALIGCGGRGTGAAIECLNVPDRLKLVAVADAFQDAAERAADAIKKKHPDKTDLPAQRIFSGFDAFRRAIDCGVDLVLLCSPPGFRPEHYRLAIEAGKHVFMEKPVCVDAPGYRSVMKTNQLADQKKLKVVVGLNSRHTAPIIETMKRVHAGAIGPIQFLRAYGNNAGVWVRPRKPGQTEMEYQMRNWYYFVWLSGDLNVEQHVHALDVANWAMGDQHPIEANGMGGRQVRKGPQYGHIFDHHVVEYTYPGGVKLFSQCRHIPGCWPAGGVYVHGLKGMATGGTIEGANPWKFSGKFVGGHQQEHFDLIKVIRDNTPHNEGYYGADASMTAVLGRMATYSGQVVRWDDAVAHGPNEMPERLAWDAKPPVLPGPDGGHEHAVAMPGVYKAW
ncbi:MAG: Gfo/Idh/MocA family oxidoreductase [Thermoguttaceae bacterium]|jgi:predicted dehydrogenase|nr:Gfo/Idh/MocA family oxidoreductase [Thermoguttaceae bacterium]